MTIQTNGPGAPKFRDASGRVITAKRGVKALRAACKLTQADLARHLGVSRRTVEGWEYGRTCGDAFLYKMAYLLAAHATLQAT